MEDLIAILFYVVMIAVALLIGYVVFNVVVNSDLPLFWKWVILS